MANVYGYASFKPLVTSTTYSQPVCGLFLPNLLTYRKGSDEDILI